MPTLPFTEAELGRALDAYPTPFHLYSEAQMRSNSRALNVAMARAGFTGFRNYFAVKALPNPRVLQILMDEGQGLDCSSLAELELAAMVGASGEDIIFSSNDTTMAEFRRAAGLGAIVNFDDVTHIAPYLAHLGAPPLACCRYNPGDLEFEDAAAERIIGRPTEAKYGMPREQIIDAYRQLLDAGVTRFGLHTMLLSNDLDFHNHLDIAAGVFELAADLGRELGIELEFINLGGGIGVAYEPGEAPFDLGAFATGLKSSYAQAGLPGLGAPRIAMENGRFMTAEAGVLLTEVLHVKRTYRTYIGTDASMADLMRPALYDAYHHISVLGPGGTFTTGPAEPVDVTGSLCENNDKFAIQRPLPPIAIGDRLVIYTTGAHGHSMGFNYNGKLRPAEVLLRDDGALELIRRAETMQDLFATLDVVNTASPRPAHGTPCHGETQT